MPADDYLVIGRIVAPHGVRGELRVELATENPDRFAGLEAVYVGPSHRRYAVTGARPHQGRVLLLLAGVADRNAAERLRGQIVQVPMEEALPLEEGAYYYHEVEGLRVVDERGQELGLLAQVLATGANDVYIVRGPRGELLLPAIRDVILSIEPAQGRVVVRIPLGLEPADGTSGDTESGDAESADQGSGDQEPDDQRSGQ
jgi:16S rRNA processing protein RimM